MTSVEPRKRVLLIIAAIAVLMYGGDLAYRRLLLTPLEADAKRAGEMLKSIQKAKRSVTEAKHVAHELEGLEARSLPFDVEFARSEYQAWLLKLANDANLENTQVNSAQPVVVSTSGNGRRSRKAFQRLSFSIRGRGDIKQIVSFMYDFYAAGHLQKIVAVHLSPVGKNEQLDMSLSIEALALATATRQSKLTMERSSQLAHEELNAYECIVSRNLFVVGGNSQLALAVTLTALTKNVQGVPEAWFTIGLQQETSILRSGSVLVNGPLEAKVISIDPAAVVVDINGELLRIFVGQTLADGQPVHSDVALNAK